VEDLFRSLAADACDSRALIHEQARHRVDRALIHQRLEKIEARVEKREEADDDELAFVLFG
jgi:hypothetical protein